MFPTLGEEHCTPRTSARFDETLKQLQSYGGQPATDASFGFVAGKFGKFSLTMDPSRYEAVRNSVIAGYGKGIESQRRVQTVGGMTFESRTYTVSLPDGTITVSEHAGQIDQGSIDGRSKEFESYIRRVQEGDPKAGSKDL